MEYVHHAPDDLIDVATVIARDGADGHADERRDTHHDEADDERHACTEEHARENVAAELIEAEPVVPRWTLQTIGEILRRRIPRQQPWGADGGQKYESHDPQTGACLP